MRAVELDGIPIPGLATNLNAYLEGRPTPLATIVGRTDAQGNATFNFNLPDTLTVEQTRLVLQAAVAGPESVEWAGKTVPVSTHALIVDAVPEGRRLRPGIENRGYLLATTPDGVPVQADFDISILDRAFSLTGNRFGLAEFTMTPPPGLRQVELDLVGRDTAGRNHANRHPLRRANRRAGAAAPRPRCLFDDHRQPVAAGAHTHPHSHAHAGGLESRPDLHPCHQRAGRHCPKPD